jgi:hypothetical protein
LSAVPMYLTGITLKVIRGSNSVLDKRLRENGYNYRSLGSLDTMYCPSRGVV